MPQLQRLGTKATTTRSEDGALVVQYYATDVVRWDCAQKTITLNTGGYSSQATKTRMNQASNQFDLGYTVYVKKGEWFVWLPGLDIDIPFEKEVITFNVETGEVL